MKTCCTVGYVTDVVHRTDIPDHLTAGLGHAKDTVLNWGL